ncbi:NAD(P)-binding domain protein [Niveomyces insectorum RCEF 264]|uniref:NAD(P)-binding domain protein n=1 Tax=Niveomyces insectorum RCEF 264 TaxID=1081102 RepID=A0A167MNW6_9HYPO|nr:NAD(P)-binding domain protein [Niveomyces insectorum RCEF 264]
MAEGSQFAIYPSLRDRVVVISGGAAGIGSSMVEAFARQGAQVVFLDILDDAASALIDMIGRLASEDPAPSTAIHRPVYYHCDVTDIDGSVLPTAAQIRRAFPQIHAVVNNAGHDARLPTLEITTQQWDDGLAVNLRHVFFLTQALLPCLTSLPCSSVVNIGSITWAIPGVGLVPYITSKAAIVGLTKTLAREFGPQGVRVNSIMPGAIATERQKRDIITPEYEAHVLQNQALKRILQPEEIARLAMWLVSDDSWGMTNQSLVLDGGWI